VLSNFRNFAFQVSCAGYVDRSFGITSHAPASRHLLTARISFAMRPATKMLRHGASLAEIGEVLTGRLKLHKKELLGICPSNPQ